MYYIYKIENLLNHKIYIGLTNNIQRRKNRHFSDLKRNVHDNKFLQKEYNLYKEDNFSFDVIYSGEISYKEISNKEVEFIIAYDSYHNGYNQNSGGNFGPSNGGSQLIKKDVFNILAIIEFSSRPGQVLSEIFGISRATVSRIKLGKSHDEFFNEYNKKTLEERKQIFEEFSKEIDFEERKANSTIIKSKRKLSEEQVHCILYNYENKQITLNELARRLNIKSTNTFISIKNGLSYKDFNLTYQKLTEEQKQYLASLLSD